MQHGVTPAGCFVHLLRCHLPILHARINDIHSLLHSLDWHLHQVLDENFTVILFPYRQVLALLWIQQVLDLILINLIKTQMHFPFKQSASGLLLLQDFQYVINALRNDSLAIDVDAVEDTHRVRLACSCLAVDEVGAVVAVEYVVDQRQAGLEEDILLAYCIIKDVVELVLPRALLRYHKLNHLGVMLSCEGTRPLGIDRRAWLPNSWVEDGVLDFVLEGWTNPEEYLNIFFLRICGLAFLVCERGILLLCIQPMRVIIRVMNAHRRCLQSLRNDHTA